jgi:hypothetical protein
MRIFGCPAESLMVEIMQIRSCRLDNRRTFDNFGFVHPWKVACFLAVSQQSLTGHVTHPQATVRLPRFHIFTCFQIAPGPGQKFTINHQKLLIFGTTQKPLSAIRVEFKKRLSARGSSTFRREQRHAKARGLSAPFIFFLSWR